MVAAGLVYRAMGFPPQFFTVLFAIPRVTGYLAHWRESLTDPDTKIIRPQQDYQVRVVFHRPVLACKAARGRANANACLAIVGMCSTSWLAQI